MNIFKKYRWLIIIITVVAVAGGTIFTIMKPVYYDTSISFSINRLNHQTTGEYQYDGYYAIQASDLFSQTVMSWMLTPSVLLEIYSQAEIDPQITSLEEISSRFKAKKYSPQNIVISYKERDYDTAEKISSAIITIVEAKAKTSNTTTDDEALFDVKGTIPVIVERAPILWLNILISLISGLVISSLAAYIIEYLRKDNIQQENQ
ncbi:MAG: hypothetical protein ACNFW9_01605 [Candidatus Kerfeldbacteria bacterium]|jgi:capsular polysaccharide biosynthesis protein